MGHKQMKSIVCPYTLLSLYGSQSGAPASYTRNQFTVYPQIGFVYVKRNAGTEQGGDVAPEIGIAS